MKKTFKTLALTVAILGSINIAQAQIKVINGGNVGIGLASGENPNWKLDVNGSVGINGPMTVNGNILFRTNLNVNEKVSIGEYANTSSAYKLEVDGDVRFGTNSGFETSTVRIVLNPMMANPFRNIPALYSTNRDGAVIGTYNYPMREINATFFYGTLYTTSDIRMKTNIALLNNSKEKNTRLDQIKVYTYDFDKKYFDSIKNEDLRIEMMAQGKNQTGVMAQEVKEIFPELVKYDSLHNSYAVNYVGFIPYLIQAVQDLSNENESLKAEILSIRQNCCLATKPIITKQGTSENLNQETIVLSARLDQNKPNPFKEGTQISYFIPEQAKKAGIYIYDLNGKQVKQLPITEKGEGSLRINGQELTAGMYLYTLIIDNMPIDTKRMILTE